MVPSPATVMRLRYFVRVGCRVVGLLLTLWALTQTNHLAEVLLGAAQGSFGSLGVGAILAALIPMASLAGPGVMVFCFAQRLSRWLVPMPANRCPYCDYPLGAVEDDRCPECGLVLGRMPTSFPAHPAATTPASTLRPERPASTPPGAPASTSIARPARPTHQG